MFLHSIYYTNTSIQFNVGNFGQNSKIGFFNFVWFLILQFWPFDATNSSIGNFSISKKSKSCEINCRGRSFTNTSGKCAGTPCRPLISTQASWVGYETKFLHSYKKIWIIIIIILWKALENIKTQNNFCAFPSVGSGPRTIRANSPHPILLNLSAYHEVKL